MRPPATVDATADWVRRIGRDGFIVRAVIAAGAALGWGVAMSVGDHSWILTAVLAVVTIQAVSNPDSPLPLVLIAALILMWMIEVQPMSVGWSVVFGLSVLVVHVAAARAASLADGARLDLRVLRRWIAQASVAGAALLAVWAAVLILDDGAVSGDVLVSAAAIVAIAGLGWLLAVDAGRGT
jgi:hypothetical protein